MVALAGWLAGWVAGWLAGWLVLVGMAGEVAGWAAWLAGWPVVTVVSIYCAIADPWIPMHVAKLSKQSKVIRRSSKRQVI